MTRLLWTGESEYCTCTHHIKYHFSIPNPSIVPEVDDNINYCNYIDRKQMIPTRCICSGFKPYKK